MAKPRREGSGFGRISDSPDDLSYSILLDRVHSAPRPLGQAPIYNQVQLISNTEWIDDYAVNGCQICEATFTTFFRTHHCRACGRVICNNCSLHRMILPKGTGTYPKEKKTGWGSSLTAFMKKKVPNPSVRVCDHCYLKYTEVATFQVWILVFEYLTLKEIYAIASVSTTFRQACNHLKSSFREIPYVLPGYSLTPYQIRLLWRSAPLVAEHSVYVLKLLTSTDWNNSQQRNLMIEFLITIHPQSRTVLARLVEHPEDENLQRALMQGIDVHERPLWNRIFKSPEVAEHLSRLHSRNRCTGKTLMCGRSDAREISEFAIFEVINLYIPDTDIRRYLVSRLTQLSDFNFECMLLHIMLSLRCEASSSRETSPLMELIVARCLGNIQIRTYSYWCLYYLKCWNAVYREYYDLFLARLNERVGEDIIRRELIHGANFIEVIKDLPDVAEKVDYGRHLRSRCHALPINIQDASLTGPAVPQVPLPVCPHFLISSINPSGINFCNSSTAPLLVPLKCLNSAGVEVEQKILLKRESVIKDYVVMNIIRLIDRILQEELHIDFGIKTYCVLPVDKDSGIIEIVPRSKTIHSIIAENGLLYNYILDHNRHCTVDEIRGRFVKSAAAYCVISYLLGIGDRHMDNILVTEEGYLLHIDYGYILGFDPKHVDTSMRITSDIVGVMGGENGEDYKLFEDYCSRIYTCLRAKTSLIMSILLIVTEVGLNLDEGKYKISRLKSEISSRFMPGETTNSAESHLFIRIDDSRRNKTLVAVDIWHTYASSLRSLF